MGLEVVANAHLFKHWNPLDADWIKLNLHGACSSGGLLRDWFDQWIQGFYLCIRRGGIISTELKGALNGLIMAWDLGFRRV